MSVAATGHSKVLQDVRVAADEDKAADLLDRWRPAAVLAPVPPNLDAVASYLAVITATPGTPVTEDPRVAAVVAAPLDRADLLAAVWVAVNP